MSNIIDYVQWRGDLSFRTDPLNAVDTLIFSALCYLELREPMIPEFSELLSLPELIDRFFSQPNYQELCITDRDCTLAHIVREQPRFSTAQMRFHRDCLLPAADTQFAAETWCLDDGSCVITFRGTDRSIIGWREDLNMSLLDIVPSQKMAADYLSEVLSQLSGNVILAGHSKGGNLAMYAAAAVGSELQNRISAVFNFDGPGFQKPIVEGSGYQAIRHQITSFVPQDSVVGLLLEHPERRTVVESTGKGIMQHDLYSWRVIGSGFVTLPRLTDNAIAVDGILRRWIAEKSREDMATAVETVFAVMDSSDVNTTSQFLHPGVIAGLLKNIVGSESARTFLSQDVQNLFTSYLTAIIKHKVGIAPTDKHKGGHHV